MLTLLAVKHKIYYLNLHKLAKYEVTTKWKITGLLCPLKPPESNDKSIKTFKKNSLKNIGKQKCSQVINK